MSLTVDSTTKRNTAEAVISPENYTFLLGQIYKESGIVLDGTKQYLIEARLLPIVRRDNLGTLDKLCARLRTVADNTPFRREVIEAMTTNETLFFRDINVFDTLRTHVFPALIEKRSATRRLAIWSAAASTGQEAYSLAMMLLEMGLENWNVRILGTDLNTTVLDKAREGRYIQLEVNRGLPAKYLIKYFKRAGLDWQVKDEVKRMVEFRPFDLRSKMRGMGPFDLILCRNVLIYFDMQTKKQILGEILNISGKQGLLLLGSAETTLNIEDRFARRVIGQTTFYEAP